MQQELDCGVPPSQWHNGTMAQSEILNSSRAELAQMRQYKCLTHVH